MNQEIKLIEIKDIPERLSEELERLHMILNYEVHEKYHEWAKAKIDNIHSLFFMCSVELLKEDQ